MKLFDYFSLNSMPVAVKLSNKLAEEARSAAGDADRSLTGQIEHWARIGKSMESRFTAAQISFIKKHNGDLSQIEDEQERARILEVLEKIVLNPASQHTNNTPQAPLYEADPENPNQVIQVQADGSKIHGQFVDRVFIAS